MKLYLSVLTIAGLLPNKCLAAGDRQVGAPNIVIILADDMGYSDIGCYGGEIQTPNLDKLASQGLRLTQMYNAARCCPSRASLLTGLYPHQAGVGDMLKSTGLPGYQDKLNKSCVTLAEVLGSAGYHSMISGKWHLGRSEDAWPMKRGFHRQYASDNTTGHYFGITRQLNLVVEDTLRQPPGEWIKAGETEYQLFKNPDGSQWYATDAYTDRAIGYIRELRSSSPAQPFFLYLSYTAPHWPLHAFEEDISKYEGKYLDGWDAIRQKRFERMTQMGLINPGWKLSERNRLAKEWEKLSDDKKKYYDRLMAVYAAMVDRMDYNIGRLLHVLEETGDLDNTLILFLSDNGGSHEEPHRGLPGALPGTPDSFDGYEAGWASVSNTPFSWFKVWTHEGGIATPFIAWFPEMISAGRVETSVSHIIDVMPTLVEISGAEYPEQYKGKPALPYEGKSLVPLFTGNKFQGNRSLGWEHLGNRAFRSGDWKLVSRSEGGTELPWELYNMISDRTETSDLSDKMPDKVIELEKMYLQWAKRVNVVPFIEKLKLLRKDRQ